VAVQGSGCISSWVLANSAKQWHMHTPPIVPPNMYSYSWLTCCYSLACSFIDWLVELVVPPVVV
jgi:hypothetical protein